MAKGNRSDAPLPDPPLSRNLSFHLLWSSTFASGFGDRLAMLAVMVMLGYGAVELAGRPVSDSSSIAAAADFFFFLPYVFWGPIAGWLADRLPRKWLLFAADQMRGLIILYAFLLLPAGDTTAVDPAHHWKIYGLMLAVGVMAATFNPTRTSFVPNVVGYRFLQRANAVVLGLGVIGNLLGFALGGPLAAEAVRWCVLISALCYMVSGSFWVFVKTPAAKHAADEPAAGDGRRGWGPADALRQIADGGRYVLQHKPLWVLALTNILFWAGTSVVMAAGAVLATQVYGGDVRMFAHISLAFGVGMLTGSLVLGVMNVRSGGELILVIALFWAGVFVSLLMVVPSFRWGLALAFLTGVFGGTLMIVLTTMMQQLTADRLRGRVFGFRDMASMVAKVAVAGLIWQAPESDVWMRWIGVALGFGLILMSVWGTWRYVMHGPVETHALNLFWRMARLWTAAVHRVEFVGRRHIPRTGPVIIVSNHASGVDPMLIQSAVPQLIRWMMAAEFRTLLWPLWWFWKRIRPIGVRRDQRDSAAVRDAIAALRAGDAVGIFPEGGINREGGPMRRLDPGIAIIAKRSEAPILPVFVSGTPRVRSAILAILLPSRSRVTFGEPFTLDPHADRDVALAEIRLHIEQLAGEPLGAPAAPAV